MALRKASETYTSDYFKAIEHVGELILFRPLATGESRWLDNDGNPKTAVFADVIILTGDQAGHKFENAELTTQVFVNTLRSIAGTGDEVVGRLTGGPTLTKPKNGYDIGDVTKADLAVYEKFLAAEGNIPF